MSTEAVTSNETDVAYLGEWPDGDRHISVGVATADAIGVEAIDRVRGLAKEFGAVAILQDGEKPLIVMSRDGLAELIGLVRKDQ